VRVFLEGRMFGAGNVLRHLGILGYHLRYEQNTIAELDLSVTDLTLELRDGLRLAKLLELFTGAHWSVCLPCTTFDARPQRHARSAGLPARLFVTGARPTRDRSE
jgi:hypothetical protein